MSGDNGSYSYLFTNAVQGHTYLVSFIVIYLGSTFPSQRVIFIPSAGPGTNPPVSSSASMATIWQQQLADVVAAKTAALQALAAAISSGVGPSYSISGRAGGESISWTEFLNALKEQIKTFTELEKTLMEMIQDVQPFDVPQRFRAGGPGPWRIW